VSSVDLYTAPLSSSSSPPYMHYNLHTYAHTFIALSSCVCVCLSICLSATRHLLKALYSVLQHLFITNQPNITPEEEFAKYVFIGMRETRKRMLCCRLGCWSFCVFLFSHCSALLFFLFGTGGVCLDGFLLSVGGSHLPIHSICLSQILTTDTWLLDLLMPYICLYTHI